MKQKAHVENNARLDIACMGLDALETTVRVFQTTSTKVALTLVGGAMDAADHKK